MDRILTESGIRIAEDAGSFIEDESERLSYTQLDARVRKLIATWAGQNWAGGGSTVALPMTNNIAGITAFIALLRNGVSIALLPADDTGSRPQFCSAVLDPTTMAVALNESGPQLASSEREPCVYLKTSGSTGTPKWVVFGQEQLVGNADGVRDRMRIDQQDCVLVSTPLPHMFGLGGGLLPALLAGASVKVTKSGDPLSILKAEREADPTVAFLIPSQCRALLPLRRSARQYRVIIVGVGRLSPEFMEAFEKMNGTVAGMYGSTELGAAVGAHPGAGSDRRYQYIGPAMKSVRVFVEADQSDGAGRSIGPVFIEHVAGYLGYANMAGELIAAAPDRQPMGDLGALNEFGDLDIVGRVDDRIKRDGFWVLTKDIEACLSDAEGVAEAAVISTGMTRRGAGIVAYVVSQAGAAFEATRLLQVCKKNLPGHMVPDEILELQSFKRLASGKIDLQALTEHAEERLRETESDK